MSQVVLLIAAALMPLSSIAQRPAGAPFVAIGVRYMAPVDPEPMRQDFQAIRASGFNAIMTSVSWKDGEPRRGGYNLLHLDRVIAVATEAGLRVHVDVLTEPEPSWKTDGTHVLAGTFYEYVRKRVGSHPTVIDVALPDTNPIGENERASVGTGPGLLTMRQARVALWSAIARGSRGFSFGGPAERVSPEVLALGEVAGVITRNSALFAPLRRRQLKPGEVTVKQAGGGVSVSILESAQAIAVIAVNQSPDVRKVTITFPPDTPEAIWQNMEAGNEVHFVMGSAGPVLAHTFAGEDVLVLAISKKLR